MPPLALTHAKYAFAMFGMSVNDVPGWLVAMAPSAIGVPVAATPGLVPHCVVLTAEVLAEDVLAGALLSLSCCWSCCLSLSCCSRRRRSRWPRRGRWFFAPRVYLLSSLPLFGGEFRLSFQFTVTTILMASGGRFMANSNASPARVSGK